MKIAIDCHTLEIKNWAGKEQFLFLLLGEFKNMKQDEFILYFRRPILNANSLPENFYIKSYRLFTPLWHLRVLIDMLVNKINCLLCPCTYLLPAINIFVPQCVVVHDLTPFLSSIARFHKFSLKAKEKLTLKLAIHNSKKVISVSGSTKNDLIKKFNIDLNKIEVVPLAASDEYKKITNFNLLNKIRYKYKIPEKFILFVGTLEPRKNLVGLIKAYNKFKQTVERSPKLVIVGKKGWYWEEIFECVKDFSLEKKILFLDYVPEKDLPYIYNLALFFVYPSFYEGFGIPILEAMACGCPVITSDTSSMPEVAGEAAILIDPNNYSSIASAINKLFSDEALRKQMVEKGFEQAKKFSWNQTANDILNTMRKTN